MIKKLFITPAFFFALTNMLFAGEDDCSKGPQGPRYRVLNRTVKEELKKSEAVFEFIFNDPLGFSDMKLELTYNGSVLSPVLNSDHKFTLKAKPGKYRFTFSSKQRNIRTDSILIDGQEKVDIAVYFYDPKARELKKKPVIYFYPETTTDISVQLVPEGEMTFTYPEYKKGWNFTADPNGTIHMNGKEYNYLFWEGEGENQLLRKEINKNEGFIVSKNNLLGFLETSLTKMGFNTKEQQDFITFWYPLMLKNENNQISFLFNEEYNKYADLTVTPAPDHILRMFMIWKKAEENTTVIPQEFPEFTRTGFTLVEWGGTEIETIIE